MGNGAIVYRGYGVQGVQATWAMGPMDNGGTVYGVQGYGQWGTGYGAYAHRPHCPCAPLAM